MRRGIGPMLGRVAGLVLGAVGLGVCLRLILAILEPVLPGPLFGALMAGWTKLFEIVEPTLAPALGIGILAAFGWIILGSRK